MTALDLNRDSPSASRFWRHRCAVTIEVGKLRRLFHGATVVDQSLDRCHASIMIKPRFGSQLAEHDRRIASKTFRSANVPTPRDADRTADTQPRIAVRPRWRHSRRVAWHRPMRSTWRHPRPAAASQIPKPRWCPVAGSNIDLAKPSLIPTNLQAGIA